MKPRNSIHIDADMETVALYLDSVARHAVALVDMEGRMLYANPHFLYRFEAAEDQLANTPVGIYLHFDRTLDELNEQFRGKAAPFYPYVHASKSSGEQFTTPYSIISVQADGQPAYLIVLPNPENTLSPSLLQRFSDIFIRDVNLGVMLIDLDYSLIDISDRACEILGFDRERVLGRSFDDIFATVPVQHRLVQRTILDGVIVRNHAVSWANNDRRYDLLLDSNVLRDHQGCIVGAYVMFKDVTNLRSLEAQVQRSDRLAMIGQIAAGTAHEIRNPLTSIKGFLQLLRATFEQKDMGKERSFTEVMLAEIDRINELVSEFLLLSKQRDAMLASVDVQAVLHGILPIIENEAILHNVEVRYERMDQLPSVIADQEMLKQVFLNVCKNGIEAMPDGGKLTITEKMDAAERKVLIDIHDTGPGIPPFLIDKIFDPFFTTKEEGTGLGLSVCQRIIHDIGGTIRVSSKGYGTTFTLGIPFP